MIRDTVLRALFFSIILGLWSAGCSTTITHSLTPTANQTPQVSPVYVAGTSASHEQPGTPSESLSPPTITMPSLGMFTSTLTSAAAPVISPVANEGSNWIAYVSSRTGKQEIYLIDEAGENQVAQEREAVRRHSAQRQKYPRKLLFLSIVFLLIESPYF